MYISPAFPFTVDLADIGPDWTERVGGKATNLAAMLRKGLHVPPGFVITTDAYYVATGEEGLGELVDRIEKDGSCQDEKALKQAAAELRSAILGWCEFPRTLRQAIARSYEAISAKGHSLVAVRSSSTAEDLVEASFAGQYDSYLNVSGIDNVLNAVRQCWASLWSDRAVQYRIAHAIPAQQIKIAVIVQAMVDARAAGVLFTVNPLTGNRAEMVVEATGGLGEAVVSGTIVPDQYVVSETSIQEETEGCLSRAEIIRLRNIGRDLEAAFGSPQDAEWAINHEGELWLTQSRPITTAFPIPASPDERLRAYWSVNVYQGLAQPFTPIGSMMIRQRQKGMQKYMSEIGFHPEIIDVDGWLYWDITEGVCDNVKRLHMSSFVDSLAAPSGQIITSLGDDKRLAEQNEASEVPVRRPRKRWELIVPALLFPRFSRHRVHKWAERRLKKFVPPQASATPHERLDFVEGAFRAICRIEADIPRAANSAGAFAPQIAARLLGKLSNPAEITAVYRGVPNNPTTEMDLSLWRLAVTAFNDVEARRLLSSSSPKELVAIYKAAQLPEMIQRGMTSFLGEYGCRVAAEIDFGVPRWSDNPEPVVIAIVSYMRSIEIGGDACAHFETAKREAEQHIGNLVSRLPRRDFGRRLLVRFLLERSRELRGLREFPKLQLMKGFAILRDQLVLVGKYLQQGGKIEASDDVMFLDLDEIRKALGDWAPQATITSRRAIYDRESKRRRVPAVVLSNGTIPELPQQHGACEDQGCLRGLAAATGIATGRAKVVHDPDIAEIEPGEILVCPSTDPGWTPLFLNAAALVTETGGLTSHGTTVAREYGIPAVVGVNGATRQIEDGQIITVNGSQGTVTIMPSTSDGQEAA